MSQFVWTMTLSYSVKDVFSNFIDAPDRSKISSDQKRLYIALSLYPLSFFANTPFNLIGPFSAIHDSLQSDELARGVNFLKGFRFFAGHPVSTE